MSQSYFTYGNLPPVNSSWRQAPWDLRLETNNFIFQRNICGYSPYVTSSLMRGWVRSLRLLLVLASAVTLRSESCGSHDHISLSQIRDSPNLEGEVPVFIYPRNRVARLYSQALGSLFVASYDSQDYGESIRLRLHTEIQLNWLSLTVLLITYRHGPHRKHRSITVLKLLPWKHACLRSRYLATAVV
jgi:hypothetical protein